MSASAGRVLLIPKGEYNSQTTYQPLDMVYYNGNSYVCKLASTGNLPTDTTYFQIMTQGTAVSDMTGATAGAAGTHGLVPAPAAGDEDKVLKGDGTWDEMEGGHTILDSEGNTMPKRGKLQFDGMIVKDDSTNDVTIVKPYTSVYGFHQNFSDTNPNTTITYLSNTTNANYSPMMTNKDAGTVTAGGWETFLTDVLFNKPAMVKTDGTLDYWLDPNDYTKKLDGTSSDVTNTSYSGAGAFAWINRIYMKEVYAANGNSRDVYFAFGEKPDDTYYPVGFVDENDNVLEGLWIPMAYAATNGKTLLNSAVPLSRKTLSVYNTTISGVSTRARFFGGAITNVIRDLMYMLFKSTDMQTKAGYGYVSTTASARNDLLANGISANGDVVGFYGSNSSAGELNKAFHSLIFNTYNAMVAEPYQVFNNKIFYYSPKYVYSANPTTDYSSYDATSIYNPPDTSWAPNIWTTKLKQVSPNFGSIAVMDNTGSGTTGLTDSVAVRTGNTGGRADLAIDISTLTYHYGCVAYGGSSNYLYIGINFSQQCYAYTTDHWAASIGVLMLPPANYTPITA